MLKKGLIFGLLGFLISLGTIHLTLPKKEIASQELGALKYEDGINGWISFGNILEEYFRDPLLNKDPIFIEMFMLKVFNPIRISNKPEIIVTENNNSIFWTNGVEKPGTKYTGWQEKANERDFLIRDSLSIVKIDITSSNGRVAGHLYLRINNKPNPKEFSNIGWQYYGNVLSTSNTMRGYIGDRNRSGIKSYIDKVTKKEDIINLTVLAGDKTVIWDIKNANIGKKMQGGWIEQEKSNKKDDRSYFSLPVKSQETNIADIHFLVKLPAKKEASPIQNIMVALKNLLKPKHLMVLFISFIILFVAGGVLTKTGVGAGISKAAFAKSGPGLQNKIQVLKEEIEQLETTKASVMEEVAKKQKTQKDIEKEIELLKSEKESIPAQPATAAAPAATATATTAEAAKKEDKSEEALLFDKLLGEDSGKSAKKKEELELTQRIVAKRREEIALSGKIETRRKELLKLEQDIENLKKE